MPAHDGRCKAALLRPHLVQRADRHSMSLDASGPPPDDQRHERERREGWATTFALRQLPVCCTPGVPVGLVAFAVYRFSSVLICPWNQAKSFGKVTLLGSAAFSLMMISLP